VALNKNLDNLLLLQEVVARRQAEFQSAEQKLRLEFDAAAGQEARLRVQCDTGAEYVATTAREKASISAAVADADAEVVRLEALLSDVRTRAAELRRQEASMEGSMQQMAVTNAQLGVQLSAAQDAFSLVKEQLSVVVSNHQAAENEVSKVNVDLTKAQEELSRHLASKASTERRIDQLKKKEVALRQVLSRLERERAAQLELKRQRELTASQRLQKEKLKELDALREKQLEIERSLRQEEDRIKKLGEM
jgi:chromosome segregation ATPase